MSEGDVLERVRAIKQARGSHYGPPGEHWARTVGAINALYGTCFTAEDWGVFMVCDKLARDRGPRQHPDNLDDSVGYLACIDEIRQAGT